MEKLVSFSSCERTGVPVIRFDPAVNSALNFAMADDLIMQQKTGSYKLTEKGREMAHAIDSDSELMIAEKSELDILSKSLSEEKINALSDSWRRTYAEN